MMHIITVLLVIVIMGLVVMSCYASLPVFREKKQEELFKHTVRFSRIINMEKPQVEFKSKSGYPMYFSTVNARCGSGMASALTEDSTKFYLSPVNVINNVKAVCDGKTSCVVDIPVKTILEDTMCTNGNSCTTNCIKIEGEYKEIM